MILCYGRYEVITICPLHKKPLVTKCPHLACQKYLTPLTSQSRLGYCAYCTRWLGISTDLASSNNLALNEKEQHWQAWVILVIGELLANSNKEVSPGKLAKTIEVFMKYIADGNQSKFANYLQLSSSAVSQ